MLLGPKTDQRIALLLVLRFQPQAGTTVQHRFHRDLLIDGNHTDVAMLNPGLSADDDVIPLINLPVDHTVALYEQGEEGRAILQQAIDLEISLDVLGGEDRRP